MPCSFSSSLLRCIGLQFASKSFDACCSFLGVKGPTTAGNYLQSTSQFERFNRTIVALFQQFVNDHQSDLNLFFRLLTNVYSRQVHLYTTMTHSSQSLTREPSGAPPQKLPEAFLLESSQPIVVELRGLHVLHWLPFMNVKADKTLKAALLNTSKIWWVGTQFINRRPRRIRICRSTACLENRSRSNCRRAAIETPARGGWTI